MTTLDLNGHRAYCHDGGVAWDPARPAVAFLHGAGGDHTLWQQQSRALAHHGFNVAALDLPGHGRSEDVPGLEAVADYADWVAAFLEAAGLPRAALVGHSLGACIALELAARQPERVTALALLASGLTMKVSPELLRDTTEDKPRAVDFITAFAHGKPAHLGHAPTPGNWMMGSGAALIAACSADVLHRDFAVCDAWDGAAAAAEVQCPTLVVAGAADRMTPPRAGKAIADAVTGARYELLPATGHMIPSEAPRQLLRLLQDFLRKVQAAA
ncbi:MAG TPA: alpha/beta hydrolase [bacterium]|nr:alpha/beta hydrolase [bacterium]